MAGGVMTSDTLPQQIARMDSSRLRAYRENLEFYQGRQWTDTQRRRERRLTLNYARTAIDKTASYTMNGVSVAVDPDDASPAALEKARRTEAVLRDVYEQNALDQLDFDNEVDCSVLGDAACKVTWDAGRERIRVTAPDVQGLFAWTAGDDLSRVWRVASRYILGNEEAEQMFGALARPRPGGHEIVESWTDTSFELWLDGALTEESANPYGFIPFVIYPNIRERIGPRAAEGTTARTQSRHVPALDDPRAEREPDRRPRERDRGAGHRGTARRRLGDP
jgi:hypothetical protein